MADIFNLTDTWNSGGTTYYAIKMNVTNTASAAASRIMELQVSGSSKLSVDTAGTIQWGGTSGPILDYNVSNSSAFTFSSGGYWFSVSSAGPNAVTYNLGAYAGGTARAKFTSPADGVLGVRNGSDGVGTLNLSTTTVSGLISAATAGAGSIAFVTDATATTARSTVAGGGSNFVMVMSNGTNWLIVA